MKYLILLLGFCVVWQANVSVAQKGRSIPSFQRLDMVAGSHVDSVDFKRLLRDYQFSENPKRANSWGSGFGVFLEQSKEGFVSIGIRLPSATTNMPTYSGTLPKGLVSEDTIEAIKQKLGEPAIVKEPEKGYIVLYYDGFRIIVLRGKLFEIWLTELNDKATKSDEPKRRSRRF